MFRLLLNVFDSLKSTNGSSNNPVQSHNVIKASDQALANQVSTRNEEIKCKGKQET
jgi:hypothetical protein